MARGKDYAAVGNYLSCCEKRFQCGCFGATLPPIAPFQCSVSKPNEFTGFPVNSGARMEEHGRVIWFVLRILGSGEWEQTVLTSPPGKEFH